MIRTEDNKDLYRKNTFGMRVSCARYLEYDSVEDLFSIDFKELPKPVMHIGAGSNLLFAGNFPGTVLHSCIKFLRLAGHGEEDALVEVGAGAVFDSFVEWACYRGLWGTENLSLIPGEAGAAAVQNIGAYGVEAKDIIVRVNCFDLEKRDMVTFENADCRYGYRDSFFKNEGKGRYVITSVLFRLARKYSPRLEYGGVKSMFGNGMPGSPADVREAISKIRRSKLPDPAETGSAGSFFKNPVVPRDVFERIEAIAAGDMGSDAKVPHFVLDDGVKVPAAWLIEHSGLKGASVGGAALYEHQPLVIVNRSGDASPEDILTLERIVVDTVKNKFGVELHPEVEHVMGA